MDGPEADFEAEAVFEVDLEEAKEVIEPMAAGQSMHHDGKRSALYARRKDAGQQTTQTKSAKLHARSSSLHVTLQVDSRP